jgi:hypothetical protein
MFIIQTWLSLGLLVLLTLLRLPAGLRGWIVTRRNGSTNKRRASSNEEFNITYKRFNECLSKANFLEGHKALNLNALIHTVYQRLDTSVSPSMSATVLPDTPLTKQQPTKSKKTTPAQKRRSVAVSPEFELVHPHDPGSFQQRLTLNTKCLQIALFLMDFLFPSDGNGDAYDRTNLYFSMFSGCYSSRKLIEFCHGLLVMFDGSSPNKADLQKRDPQKPKKVIEDDDTDSGVNEGRGMRCLLTMSPPFNPDNERWQEET